MNDELQHTSPAWKSKADFVVGAKIDDPTWAEHYPYEQLAVAERDNRRYIVCCIPFALYNICLGDYVTVDDEFNINKVVERSDYVGFRVATDSIDDQDALLHSLHDFEVAVERHSDFLLALAVSNAVDGKRLAVRLQVAEDEKLIVQYETINTRP